MVVWRIYYGDGTTAEGDTQAGWDAAPALGVQAVVAADELPLSDVRSIGRAVYFGMPFYIWLYRGATPIACDVIGLLDNLVQRGLATLDSRIADFSLNDLAGFGVKTGRSISADLFDQILVAATHDPGFPAKSATRAGESFIDSLPRV